MHNSKWNNAHTSSWDTPSSPSKLSPVWEGSSASCGTDVIGLSCGLSYWPNDEPLKKNNLIYRKNI